MIERDFLTPFEQASSASPTVDEGECAFFKQAIPLVEAFNESIIEQVELVENPEKRLAFEAFTPMLVAFASKNCGYLRIGDSNPLLVEAEMKFIDVHGDFDEYLLSGGTLSQIFRRYRDFSLDVSPDNYVRLQFTVPLYDVTKSENPVCE